MAIARNPDIIARVTNLLGLEGVPFPSIPIHPGCLLVVDLATALGDLVILNPAAVDPGGNDFATLYTVEMGKQLEVVAYQLRRNSGTSITFNTTGVRTPANLFLCIETFTDVAERITLFSQKMPLKEGWRLQANVTNYVSGTANIRLLGYLRNAY